MEWVLAALGAANLALLAVLALRKPPGDDTLRAELLAANERLERELRREVDESSRGVRQELTHGLTQFQESLVRQAAETARTQNAQIDTFGQQLAVMQKGVADTLAQQLQGLSEANARRLSEVRATLEGQLALLQQNNAAKLDEMRQTVDEKLQSTLETRFTESFKQVAERLEQVHQGLGQMQTLAQGVGDLQRVLTNVKTRGMFGEVQLEALLEQVKSGAGDWDMLLWVNEHAPLKRTALEIQQWADWTENVSFNDVEMREWFTDQIKRINPAREDLRGTFDYLDLDDFVSFGGVA